MRIYISPSTDIVMLNTMEQFMEEQNGNPRGSYVVDPLEPNDPITIGGDDENANSYNVSLWEEE